MRLITTGATRWVLLIGRYAIKFPRPTHYRSFLNGMLGNDQEKTWWSMRHEKLCPVLWCGPLRLILIMPRCKPVPLAAFPPMMDDWREISHGVRIPVEMKEDSFGFYKGRIVAIDYGS